MSRFLDISAGGRYVAFYSYATNLVPGDTNGAQDVFVKDTQTGAIERVSTDSAGSQANGSSYDPAISGDGMHVSFHSSATNLVPGVDNNSATDVFFSPTSACSGGVIPPLTLSMANDAYWASSADYTNRLLSVDLVISNTGIDTAYLVRLVGTVNTQDVSYYSSEFADGFIVTGGGNVPGMLKYTVPEGVGSFFTTVYATALDGCGNSYSYPAGVISS